MAALDRPVPVPDADDGFFWSNLSGGLVLPRCEECGHQWLRPIPACPACGSTKLTLQADSGAGTVYSWVVVNRALDPAFTDDAPYVVLTVELGSGARLVGRLLGELPPYPQMRVQFEPWRSGGAWVPGFRPVDGSGGANADGELARGTGGL